MNELFEVIGYYHHSYLSKKSNSTKQKITITLAPKKEIPDVVGCIAECVMLDKEYALYRPEIGDVVRKTYSRAGFVSDLIKVI